MPGWFPVLLLTGVVASTAPVSSSTVRQRHDFHVSYTRMAIESKVISAQIRVFSDDVTRAMIERSRATSITLNSPQGDAAFAAYLTAQFPVTVNGKQLPPTVVSSAQEKDMWSYVVTWTSGTPITAVSMHNAALFELFDDQQNIVKVKHIASGKESTLFYSGGSKADQVFRP